MKNVTMNTIIRRRLLFSCALSVLFLFVTTSPLWAQGSGDAVEIPRNVGDVKILNKEQTVYPPEAKSKFMEAVVSVDVTIGIDGSVTNTELKNISINQNEELKKKYEGMKVINKQGVGVDQENEEDVDFFAKETEQEAIRDAFVSSAIDAAKKFRFEPVLVNGKATVILYPLDFKFNLQSKKAGEDGKPKPVETEPEQ